LRGLAGRRARLEVRGGSWRGGWYGSRDRHPRRGALVHGRHDQLDDADRGRFASLPPESRRPVLMKGAFLAVATLTAVVSFKVGMDATGGVPRALAADASRAKRIETPAPRASAA